jgi:hypothetical protein
MEKLLTRTEFRESCLDRDKHKCVMCGATENLSVHHIIERRLWADEGYYNSNGATLCEYHHIMAETTDLSCDEIREAVGITKIVLPEGYYPDHQYSKWGDVILPNKMRMKGPLFNDESVQKILKLGQSYSLYTDYVKYPRTYHLPWSEGKTKDDKTLKDCSQFEGKRVIVTEKMDGENTSIYKDYIHARSIDGRDHWSRSWVKNLQAKIGYEIPEGWRFCGENLYAKHSIGYKDLSSYFALFSIWNEKNECLSWDETVAYADMLDIKMVPTLYDGVWDEKLIRGLYTQAKREVQEGYVVRVADSFPYLAFTKSVSKFVRVEHVATSHHWFFTCSEKNELIKTEV